MTTVDHLNREQEWEHAAGFTSAEQGPDIIEDNEHPFIRLPFSVSIDGRTYEGSEISMVAAKVAGLASRQLIGLIKFAVFRFNFDGFSIALPIEVKVTSESVAAGQLNLNFREPTGPHMPHLRYILNSWLAGDYVHMNGVIEAPRKTGSVSHALGAQRVRRAGRFRRFLGALLVGSASFALLIVAANAISKRLFSSDVAGVSIVDKSSTPLRATVGGQLAFIDPHAAMGKPAYSILASNGASVTVAMPCDCVIDESVENGATVAPGETLMLLSKRGAAPIVHSNFNAPDLRLLAAGATPQIELPNGETTPARVEIDRFALSAGQNPAGAIAVRLLPTQPIDDAFVGRPVNVRLDSTPAWITAAVKRLRSSHLFAAEVAP